MKYLINALIVLLIVTTNRAAFAQVEPETVVSSSPKFKNLYIVNHPLIAHKLTLMRDKNTDTALFKHSLAEIGMLMGYEITRNLETTTVRVNTPLTSTTGKKLKQEIVIVPILRAGLGMAEGLERLMPGATVGHIGLYRNPANKMPVEYYFKIPKIKNQLFIVVDPMLATGNTAIHGVQKLISSGVSPDKIVFMALVAAPEGVEKFTKAHPAIKIYVAALDAKLNSHAYIIPGLGDAGDRVYGTK